MGGTAGMPLVEPYPRVPADAELTQQIVAGPLALVGSGFTACSNGLPASGEQWCAFSRLGASENTELWVVDVALALAEGEVSCTESHVGCLQLTTNLWTGSQLWGPAHPYTHRFDGDTLIFHADAPAEVREPYEGPVYAWRPGWEAARRISTERGVTCTGHRLSAKVYCIDAVDLGPEAEPFDPPFWQAFDLLAGDLEQVVEGSLSLVERIALPAGKPWDFMAAFDRAGLGLAYSFPVGESGPGRLRWVPLTEATLTPATVLDDAAEWTLAHDGVAAYVLRGFDSSTLLGQLSLIDFPSGENVRPIADDVSHIDPVGAFDDLLSQTDQGIGYDRETADGPSFDFLADRSMLDSIVTVGVDIQAPRVSPDGLYTQLYQNVAGGFPVAKVARNDGGGACTLNGSLQAETYGARFAQGGKRVYWIEFGRSGSEEGWSADPATCEARTKFGDWVLGYSVSGDYVFFEGGDSEDSTSFLQYARIPVEAPPEQVTPLVLLEHPRYPFLSLETQGATYLLYAGPADAPEGLFVHGPLEAALPPE